MQKQQVCSEETHEQSNWLIESKGLNRRPKIEEEGVWKYVPKQLKHWMFRIGLLIIVIGMIVNRQTPQPEASCTFLTQKDSKIIKYDICNKNFITVLEIPIFVIVGPPEFPSEPTTSSNDTVVKVNDLVYVLFHLGPGALRADFSISLTQWDDIEWEDEYKYNKYIVINDSIIAAGHEKNKNLFENIAKMLNILPSLTSSGRSINLCNTTTSEWSDIGTLAEERMEHTLVHFKGRVCAVGRSTEPTVECFNPKNVSDWILLPSMKTARRNAAAVELNGELYVIGGTRAIKAENWEDSLANTKTIRLKCRQRGRMGKGVVFTTTLIAGS